MSNSYFFSNGGIWANDGKSWQKVEEVKIMTPEAKAVIEAAIRYTREPFFGHIHVKLEEELFATVTAYLASQNEVKEIEPLKPFTVPEGMSLRDAENEALSLKLNEVISLVNKLSRGK